MGGYAHPVQDQGSESSDDEPKVDHHIWQNQVVTGEWDKDKKRRTGSENEPSMLCILLDRSFLGLLRSRHGTTWILCTYTDPEKETLHEYSKVPTKKCPSRRGRIHRQALSMESKPLRFPFAP